MTRLDSQDGDEDPEITCVCYNPAVAPKNPLQLKRKTHFLAREHLRRFAGGCGEIHVYRKASQKLVSTNPDVDGLFNVNGVWSHSTENWMARIETKFWQCLASFDGSSGDIDQEAVSEYFALWRARVEFARDAQIFEGPLVGVSQRDLKGKVTARSEAGEMVEASREDLLEQRGVGFYSTDLRASARSVSGLLIKQSIAYVRSLIEAARIRWGAVRTPGMSIVLPDRTTSFDMPISPHCFLHGFGVRETFSPLRSIPPSTTRKMNRDWFDNAYQVVVARSPDVLRALTPAQGDP